MPNFAVYKISLSFLVIEQKKNRSILYNNKLKHQYTKNNY